MNEPHEPTANAAEQLAEELIANSGTSNLDRLSVDERKQLADLLLLETLLKRTLGPEASQTKPPIEAALQRIQAEAAGASPASSTATIAPAEAESTWKVVHRTVARRWNWIAAFAASFLLAVYTFYQPLAPTAEASVRRALAQAEQPADQLYTVTAVPAGPLRVRGELQAQLYVRGPNLFAIELPLPTGHAWIGSNGRQSWMVPALQLVPVHVSDDPAWLDQWLSAGDVSIAKVLLDLPSILRQLEARYTLESLPNSPLPGKSALTNQLFHHVRGTDENPAQIWPARIEFWADPQTGVIARLEMAWPEHLRKVGPQRLTFERQPSPTLPANWFEHAAHHAPERPVTGNSPPTAVSPN